MKAYTLRLDNEMFGKLKHLSIQEGKTVRELLLQLIQNYISHRKRNRNKQLDKKTMEILRKIPDEEFINNIREERER